MELRHQREEFADSLSREDSTSDSAQENETEEEFVDHTLYSPQSSSPYSDNIHEFPSSQQSTTASSQDSCSDSPLIHLHETSTQQYSGLFPKYGQTIYCKEETLDILKPDQSIAITESKINKGIKTNTYQAKYNVNVVRIAEGELSVWDGTTGERFKNGTSYHRNGHHPLFLMRFKRGNYTVNKYFLKQDGEWKETNGFGFYAILQAMVDGKDSAEMVDSNDALLNIPKTIGISLDISKPDRSSMYCYEMEEDGYIYKRFTSMGGMSFNKVVDGRHVIWRASEENLREIKALRVRYRAKNNRRMLVIYFGSGALCNGKHKYFEKVNGEWIEVRKEDYNIMHKNMQD
ncbi:hypothetical protein BEWA_035890 [Theileria equi strain WA]|uniref:Uncharacterized protein n=1 Tax=Theileria equi strain WA TaxID=1537102 RepID=L1LEF2_THEEQ|nr:hypothetical protein BEWA_035890 [Theileria equi strain WA]EKX73553.1 hypothetical protein BEWA_035890 [Theileria equi strain WA]|eukprot:XP_004833005.1 hypothetical protein BEWA_035890 [Theileria equi strain WA]